MSHHTCLNIPICNLIPKNIEGWRILDLGCGYGMWGLLLRMTKEGNPYIIGVEAYRPYFIKQIKLNVYDEVYYMNVLDFIKDCDDEFDLIICGELLEHLFKKDGLYLIEKCLTMFNKILIFTTPYKFMKNTIGYDGNIYYGKHKSGYELEEFIKRDFNIKVIRHIPIPRILRPIHFIYNKLRGRYAYGRTIVAYKRFE